MVRIVRYESLDQKISDVANAFDNYKYGITSTLKNIHEMLDETPATDELISDVLIEIERLIDDIEEARI